MLCVNKQASDYHGFCVFFAHLFTIFQTEVSVFTIGLLQILLNFNHMNKTPVNLFIANFKQSFPNNCTILMQSFPNNCTILMQSFPNNCTILMLHIIPICELHTIGFKWLEMWSCLWSVH